MIYKEYRRKTVSDTVLGHVRLLLRFSGSFWLWLFGFFLFDAWDNVSNKYLLLTQIRISFKFSSAPRVISASSGHLFFLLLLCLEFWWSPDAWESPHCLFIFLWFGVLVWAPSAAAGACFPPWALPEKAGGLWSSFKWVGPWQRELHPRDWDTGKTGWRYLTLSALTSCQVLLDFSQVSTSGRMM